MTDAADALDGGEYSPHEGLPKAASHVDAIAGGECSDHGGLG